MEEIAVYNHAYTYESQLSQIQDILALCKVNGLELIIRQHPNLGRIGCPNEASIFRKKTDELGEKNGIKIIQPEEDADWLSLSSNAILSVVPYSTLGLDLAMLGLPVYVPLCSPFNPIIGNTYSPFDIGLKRFLIMIDKKMLLANDAASYAYRFYIDSSITSSVVFFEIYMRQDFQFRQPQNL